MEKDHASFVQILGIRFLDASPAVAISILRDEGGLMVVPSGPGLASLQNDPEYSKAVSRADFAIIDSAYLAVLWFLRTRRRVHRVSGLRFMREFVKEPSAMRSRATILVSPSPGDAKASVRWLRRQGWEITEEDCYIAPNYSASVQDDALAAFIETRHPSYVVLCVGGGIQEPLGYFLRGRLSFRPAIICTGAALAFLTGEQAHISPVIDRTGFGWLARSISQPRRFLPRYAKALPLSRLVFEYRSELPPLLTNP